MSSKIIHSSLVNPAQPANIHEMQDKQDYVSMDIPLLIRLFELVREDVKTDMDLHNLVERILSIKNLGILSMDQYEQIADAHSGTDSGREPSPAPSTELESILNLAGIR
jgi:hypothetical protein